MSKVSFFTAGPAGDAYTNIMGAKYTYLEAAKNLCEELWEAYEEYADPEFLKEVRDSFDERFWEMYLTVTFVKLGYKVVCPKPGPDVGIEVDGCRIWFEAVSPSRGSDESPDRVPESTIGEVFSVPNEKIILRYLNSISEKYDRQYPRWLENGYVEEGDAFIIAINPCRLGADTTPPYILQVAFPISHPFVTIDRETFETTDSGYQFRSQVPKTSGSLVDTGVFLHNGYNGLSGLLVSRVDVANRFKPFGHDFQLLPNPVARVPLPTTFRLPGTYFEVTENEDSYVVTPNTISENG